MNKPMSADHHRRSMLDHMHLLRDLRQLDRHNVGSWPRSVRLFFMFLLMLLVAVGAWSFHIRAQHDALQHAQEREHILLAAYQRDRARVAHLPQLQKQLEAMQIAFDQTFHQLPRKTEMPQLLADISHMAQAAGLAIETFEPGVEQQQEFYAEEPITIKMRGTYRQLRQFVTDVALLPRMIILTMHDVSLTLLETVPDMGSDAQLLLQGRVKTYRYLEGSE